MSLLNAGILPSVLPGHFIKSDGIRKTWRTYQLMAHGYWKKTAKFIFTSTYLFLESLQPNFKVGDLILWKDYTLVKSQWSRTRVKIFSLIMTAK